ncbi:AAA family ATPase [Streptomyces sp. NPDC005438]|uniref:AAA family ATPase n=1 Tax=Streptomyces sp. NPDC005438 TaxID=3156880 RepID=UPI0033BE91D3
MVQEPGPAVLLLTGVMASGKSTVAQALAERLPRSVHLRGDVFRRMIVSGRQETLPEENPEALAQLRTRHRLTATVADGYAREGWTVVVQDVVLGGELSHFVTSVRTRPLYVVVLAPSPRAVRAREAGRAKSGYGAWTVEALDRALRTGTPDLGLWLDTSDQSPEETVTTILEQLPHARVA